MLVAVDGDALIDRRDELSPLIDGLRRCFLSSPPTPPVSPLIDLVPAGDDRVEVDGGLADADAEFGGTPGLA